ncbi:MAG TPA: M1 family metallopeptidase [Thermoanaerobaculia bacterium]|nr:M1 family metallopeptidase [Thermoanaerobaculia bacterium]
MSPRRSWRRWALGALLVLVAAGVAGFFFFRARYLAAMGDSGGPLRPRQAAYDVRRYELAIALDPERKRLRGRGTAIVVATSPLDAFEIQLDDPLRVARATVDGATAAFEHDDGLVTVALARAWAAGERHAVTLDYAGRPKIARRPPWSDGLVWAETPSGAPWLGVTTQGDGADLWWPAKDHPSDEPDEGLALALTLPSGLVGLSNGRKTGETVNADGTTTTTWEVGYPINNYGVTFNAAPYVAIESTYRGLDGTREVPIVFWAIREHADAARKLWREQGAKILEVLGRRFGEYPFLADKYHVAEAPYLGMEHQTLVAYGSKFENNEFGFDWLLLHETAHEWWGNKITARDWADFWLHEGFGSYSEAVYVNDTLGVDKYLEFMARTRKRVRNARPVVQGRDLTSGEAYTGDIYAKGSCVLHTLRWMLGDDTFFAALHRFATDERFAYKLVETADFERVVAELAGRETPWFWQRYLYRAELPRWTLARAPAAGGRETITLAWDDPAFELALPVAVGGEERRIEMPGGRASFEVDAGAEVAVDPRGWVLAEPAEED